MNVIIFCRVSTDEQASKGYSLAHQEEMMRKWCEINNHHIVNVYKEDYSGKTFNRPEWKKLMVFLKSNKNSVDLILFNRWDRFSRNLFEALSTIKELQKLGIIVNTVEQPLDTFNPDSKVLLSLYLTIPEVENDKNSIRTTEGSRRARKEGCWTGSPPKGYVNYRDGKNSTLRPSKYAPLIIQGFERMASAAYSANEVRIWLNQQGMKLCKNAFYGIIRNPVYMGKVKIVKWKDEPEELVIGLHPALITEELYQIANNVLDGRRRKTDFLSDKTDLYPLKGFLKCPIHRRSLTAYACTGRKNKKYHYYLCNKCKSEGRHRVTDVHRSIEEILSIISEAAQSINLYKKILEKVFDKEDINRKDEIERLNQEIERLNQRKDILQGKMLDDVITGEDYKEMKEKIEKDLSSCRSKLSDQTVGMTAYKKYITKEIPMLENLVKYYNRVDGYTKKKILSCIFSDKLTLEKGKVATISYTQGVLIMFNIINALQRSEKKQEIISDLLSTNALPPGLEPGTL
jgi:site-specific DNA recombinase